MYSRIKHRPHNTQALKPIRRDHLPETKRNINIKIVISYYKLYIIQWLQFKSTIFQCDVQYYILNNMICVDN